MTPETKHTLATLLTHEDADTRRLAAEDLAGTNERPVHAALCIALEDDSKGVRDAALRSLTHIGGVSVARAIVYHIADSDIVIRNLAAKILINLGEPAIPAILPYLRDVDKDVRKFGVDILGTIGSEHLVDSLLPLLRDEDANVRSATVEALGNIGSAEATVSLCELLVTDESTRAAVADALKNIGDSRARMFLADTFRELVANSKTDQLSLYAVIDALAALGDKSIQQELQASITDIDPTIRPIALHAIIEIAEREQLPLDLDRSMRNDLLRGLTNEHERIRMSCVKGLSSFTDGEVTYAFLDALGQSDDLDFSLICQLATRPDAFSYSLEWLEQSPIREGSEVMSLLGKLASDLVRQYPEQPPSAFAPGVVDRFFNVISDRWNTSSESTRERMVETMFAIHGDRSCAFLADRIAGEDPFFQARLLEHLGSSGTQGAQELLVHNLSNPDEMVREAALAALRQVESGSNPWLNQ